MRRREFIGLLGGVCGVWWGDRLGHKLYGVSALCRLSLVDQENLKCTAYLSTAR